MHFVRKVIKKGASPIAILKKSVSLFQSIISFLNIVNKQTG